MLMRISCKSVKFLGVSRQIPLDDLLGLKFHMFEECLRDGTIEKLQKAANSEQVYGLIYCDGDDPQHMTYSYWIVCEDKTEENTSSTEFEHVTINPSHYCVFEGVGNSPQEHEAECLAVTNQAKEYFPGSDFNPTMIPDQQMGQKGLAIIHKIAPLDLLSSSYNVQVWVPIKEIKKEVKLTRRR